MIDWLTLDLFGWLAAVRAQYNELALRGQTN
jgi:hypothetical protein